MIKTGMKQMATKNSLTMEAAIKSGENHAPHRIPNP
jgi:hypothetical protein